MSSDTLLAKYPTDLCTLADLLKVVDARIKALWATTSAPLPEADILPLMDCTAILGLSHTKDRVEIGLQLRKGLPNEAGDPPHVPPSYERVMSIRYQNQEQLNLLLLGAEPMAQIYYVMIEHLLDGDGVLDTPQTRQFAYTTPEKLVGEVERESVDLPNGQKLIFHTSWDSQGTGQEIYQCTFDMEERKRAVASRKDYHIFHDLRILKAS